MSGMPLSDAQLASGLTRQSPRAAPVGLRERILAEAEATPQVRPVPAPLSRLADADRIARRRALLLVAAALLILGLAAAGIVGAFLETRRDVIPDLSLAPPAELPTFVRSTYDLMSELEPMTISFVDGASTGRIYVDASGAIRTERYASPEDSEPETYTILRGTTKGEVIVVDGRRVWYEQEGAIGEDPRVFVYATLGGARSGLSPGCEVAVSPEEEYVGEPGRNWVYIGLEQVADRPTHHVRCGDDLWIDVETRVTLRSRSTVIGGDGQADPAQSRTIEATEVVLGQPPAHLFEVRPPDGVAAIGPEEYECAQNPYCSASPMPVVTPPPAPADTTPVDLEAVLAAAMAASDVPSAYDVVVEYWSAKYPGSTTRTLHDGAGRYRVETRFDGATEPASVMLVGEDYHYATESTTDGFIFWRDTSSQMPGERRVGYPLRLPPECVDGWQVIGVDLVQGRAADHLACPGALIPDEYWIDRETHLVLRTQSMYDEASGTNVAEVVELRFGPSPPELFELPESADVRN